MSRKMLVALMMEGKSSQLSEEPNLPYHGGWMHISEDRSSAKPKRSALPTTRNMQYLSRFDLG
jgi:hypothetical protein